MSTHRHGLFLIVDPPSEEALATVRRTIDAIEYPWFRLIPTLRADPEQAVVIRWADTGQGASGKFYSNGYEIHLSTQPYHQDLAALPFVLAHEIGHLVDWATFTDREKSAIQHLLHADNADGNPYLWHDDPSYSHSYYWRNSGDAYPERIFEAYADQFVAAFAPAIWQGHYPRFVHWTDDHQAIRLHTLERIIMAFTDVPVTHPHYEGIMWAAGQGLVKGRNDGTFAPEEGVNRGQLCTILHRQAQQQS